ncbi:MAG TPA: SDR family NAD(P)-dependent oxidoreductase [Microbacterium sp.]|nr:SDR family NAD(P)-dependent oxidoreductase [Microbacterium sp.]
MTQRVVWITGSGSGMGRASALRLAARGFAVALSGRRIEALESARDEIVAAGGSAIAMPLDVTDSDAVRAAHDTIVRELGPVTDVVASAGLNAPNRAWADLTPESFQAIVGTNLTGCLNLAHATLPGMRERGDGTVVFVSSFAGWRFGAMSGVAYGASKTAVGNLAESLNDEENVNGIRACHLCPGDVDSDFLAMRPNVPDAEARSHMMTADDVADAVEFVVTSPPTVCVNELVITPVKKGVARR